MQYALVLMLLLGSVSQSSMASAQVLERTIQGGVVGSGHRGRLLAAEEAPGRVPQSARASASLQGGGS